MEIFLGNVILFIFASIGMSHIIVDGKILQKFRDFLQKEQNGYYGYLLKFLSGISTCYQCSGFWSGAFIGYLSIVSVSGLGFFETIALTFVCGCAGAFLSPLAAIYLNVLETRMVIDYKEDSEK